MKQFKNIPHIPLKSPHPEGTEDEHGYAQIIQVFKEIRNKIKDGDRVYIGYPDGERAGSIGYIKKLECDVEKIVPSVNYSAIGYRMYDGGGWRCYPGFHAVLAWDKRPNKLKCYIGHDMVYFPDYGGPTLWEKFDKKAAEKKATEAVVVKDREGNVLEVGDPVIYINSRYGSGARLERGIVSDIKVKVRVQRRGDYSELQVIVQNTKGVEESKIRNPEYYILRTGVGGLRGLI